MISLGREPIFCSQWSEWDWVFPGRFFLCAPGFFPTFLRFTASTARGSHRRGRDPELDVSKSELPVTDQIKKRSIKYLRWKQSWTDERLFDFLADGVSFYYFSLVSQATRVSRYSETSTNIFNISIYEEHQLLVSFYLNGL